MAEAVVGSYAFSATLAIQDITGLAASGVTASHIAKRLEGSAESDAHLFALCTTAQPRPVGTLFYPEITLGDITNIDAWILISLPKLEDTRVIEATITLDSEIAPFPGEPLPSAPYTHALALIDDLSDTFDRPIRHVWVTTSPLGATSVDTERADSNGNRDADDPTHPDSFLRDAGYTPAYAETQATFSLESVEPHSTRVTEEISIVRNMDFDPDDLPSFRALLTSASKNYPRGELILDTVEWTEQRVRDAGARLLDRGGNQLTALIRTRPDDKASTGKEGADKAGTDIIGMAEAVHYDSDADSLMELGLVYVHPDHRNQGNATRLLHAILAAAKTEWPELTTGYSSHPADSQAAEALLAHYNPEVISISTAWQKSRS
ncbi:GNAT family N-acetyltransferase [Corynebacterium aquatimens]|nr:GNAT family N-acetyltransferase [Corynebacterium aquatimens]